MSGRIRYQAARIRRLEWKRFILRLSDVPDPHAFMREVEAWAKTSLMGNWSVHVQDYRHRAVLAVERDEDAVMVRLRWECHRSHTDPKRRASTFIL